LKGWNRCAKRDESQRKDEIKWGGDFYDIEIITNGWLILFSFVGINGFLVGLKISFFVYVGTPVGKKAG
jgi:hypothetical protein